MSHFDDFYPQPNRPVPGKQLLENKAEPESTGDPQQPERSASNEELQRMANELNAAVDFESIKEAPQEEQRQTPPTVPSDQPPFPPQGWICGTPYMMQQEAKRFNQKNLKHAIRSDAGKAIGLVCLFQLVMQVLASFAVMIYMVFSGITGYSFSEPVYDFVFSYLPVIICEAGALIAGLLWFKTDVKQLFRKPTLEKGEGWKAPVYTGFSLGMIQLGALVYMVYYYIFKALFGIEITVPSSDLSSANMVINVLSFAYIVIFGPLMEEIFFRGILFQKLRKYGDLPTIMLTAILFALFHMNFVQLPGPLFFGIAIGIVFSKTNSLWLCWLIHALNNFIAVFYDYLPTKAAEIYNIVVSYGLIAVGIICGIILIKDIIDVFKNRRGNCTVLGAGSKFGAMVNNVWFYLFLAFWFIMSLLTQVMA